MKPKRLYLITFKYYGLDDCYVVATDPTAAYEKVCEAPDREMESITLLAENVRFPDIGKRLHL